MENKPLISGGERGIRTLGKISPTHAFQACALNRSAISPLGTLRCKTMPPGWAATLSCYHAGLCYSYGLRTEKIYAAAMTAAAIGVRFFLSSWFYLNPDECMHLNAGSAAQWSLYHHPPLLFWWLWVAMLVSDSLWWVGFCQRFVAGWRRWPLGFGCGVSWTR
jgi:hypothetical protein